jgi:hypothetical protein
MQTESIKLPIRSCLRFFGLVARGRTQMRSERLGEVYSTDRGGSYSIFRETESWDGTPDPSVVIVCGFRLRFFQSNSLLHWVFRRVCIISSPIWAGFPGYRAKLWMIDYQTKNYLGIYEWAGESKARVYAEWLVNLLRHLSSRGSVWYELYPNEKLEEYLKTYKVSSAVPIRP